MPLKTSIGKQNFERVIEEKCFYIDKTHFIKEWWEYGDDVTLITRPRRFGKTLNMSMLEAFFSLEYAGRGDLFEGLEIWQDEKYRQLQGCYPVIFISFAEIKETSYKGMLKQFWRIIKNLYQKYDFIPQNSTVSMLCKKEEVCAGTTEEFLPDSVELSGTLHDLTVYLKNHYGKQVIILLDEYDTPMQEAYISGYWDEAVDFLRSLFNSTFKTNPALYRAVLTGITRVSKESVFSDLNNLVVITTTSEKYADAFGFTEQEVFSALEERGLSDQKENVKRWYDGFTFGNVTDIYNPWSIINFLQNQKFDTYWANTSSNNLVGKLIREGNPDVKMVMETLITGGVFVTQLDEQIIFNQLDENDDAIWSLLLASGYLKIKKHTQNADGTNEYTLALTNFEVQLVFEKMVSDWFKTKTKRPYNGFLRSLLDEDIDAMNAYMNQITFSIFSYFDVGGNASGLEEAERFYHGFVLGLLVDLQNRYRVTSNRESGFGRYDVLLEPVDKKDDAIIIEFKVFNPKKEKSLEDTLAAALEQIHEKQYDMELISRGVPKERIRHYGFAFKGKEVLIG